MLWPFIKYTLNVPDIFDLQAVTRNAHCISEYIATVTGNLGFP